MSHRVFAGFILLALTACAIGLPSDVQGCGTASRSGQSVEVADETALIVWDDATKTEHFIRRASFVGTAYDFAFLVPTPGKAELNEADAEVFTSLANITKPKVEYREETGFSLGCGSAAKNEMILTEKAMPSGVIVLDQKRVGNLDATVLGFRLKNGQTTNEAAAELLAWLNRNQYGTPPDLIEWVGPYIQQSWVITAFKIAAKPLGDMPVAPKSSGKSNPQPHEMYNLQSTTVRMSFSTDRPFFPYREPADQRREKTNNLPRLLRVYLAAKQRMSGKLGTGTRSWPGQTVWANALLGEERNTLIRLSKLNTEIMPSRWWLTEFEDRSSPRPGTDELYFEPSPDQSEVARPPEIITTYREPGWVGALCIGLPLAIVLGLVLLVGLILRRIPKLEIDGRSSS